MKERKSERANEKQRTRMRERERQRANEREKETDTENEKETDRFFIIILRIRLIYPSSVTVICVKNGSGEQGSNSRLVCSILLYTEKNVFLPMEKARIHFFSSILFN